jgi:hypothetical protein
MVWNELKLYVRQRKPNTKEEFIQMIGEFWSDILTPEKCEKYINHIPKVLPHVILQNGFASKF